MPKFQCPACNGQFEVAPEHIGLNVACPLCGRTLGTGGPAATTPVGLGQPGQSAPGGSYPPGAYPPPYWQQPGGQQMPPGYPPYIPQPPAPNPAGVWSFVLIMLYFVLSCGLTGVLMRGIDFRSPSAPAALRRVLENPPGWLAAVALVLFGLMIASFVLGLYAVTRRNRRKGLAITGLILSGLMLLCGLGQMAIGLVH